MSGNDYIKFLTQQVTTFIDSPSKDRKKKDKKQNHPSYSNYWFGLLPFAVKALFKKRSNGRNRTS